MYLQEGVKETNNEQELVQVVVRLPKSLVAMIDHYCIERDRYRAGAIYELCMEGLESIGFTWPPQKKKQEKA